MKGKGEGKRGEERRGERGKKRLAWLDLQPLRSTFTADNVSHQAPEWKSSRKDSHGAHTFTYIADDKYYAVD
jgi:hypothetical protein